jgi:hypothetical protein
VLDWIPNNHVLHWVVPSAQGHEAVLEGCLVEVRYDVVAPQRPTIGVTERIALGALDELVDHGLGDEWRHQRSA